MPVAQTLEGMSDFASTRIRRGTRTMRSSGPQPAVAGRRSLAASVISIPMMAKSPSSSSQMSGQFSKAGVLWPLACGSGPMRRRKVMAFFGVVRVLEYLLSFWRQAVLLAKSEREEATPRQALQNLLRTHTFAEGKSGHDATRFGRSSRARARDGGADRTGRTKGGHRRGF